MIRSLRHRWYLLAVLVILSSNLVGGSPALGQADTAAEVVATQEVEPIASAEAPSVIDMLMNGKYLAVLIVMVVALALLFQKRINVWVRVSMMAIAFGLFGLDFLYPLHPSPMCAVTKLFMFRITAGEFFVGFLAMLTAMLLPSLIGRHLYCGWVCPLGALQELVNKLPFKFRWKQFNFVAFNSVRLSLLALFFLTFFAVRDQVAFLAENVGADPSARLWNIFSAYSVYDPLNFFELLHWQVDTLFIIMFSVLVLSSLVLYRPFCHLICPVGALSWILGLFAPLRVRVDHDLCNDCGNCVEKSPCTTISRLIKPSVKVTPDCTSCGECLGTCPTNAISFGWKK